MELWSRAWPVAFGTLYGLAAALAAARSGRRYAVEAIRAHEVAIVAAMGAAAAFAATLAAVRPIPCSVVAVVLTTAAITDTRSGFIFDVVTLCGLGVLVAAGCAEDRGAVALAGATVTGGVPFALHALTRGRGIGLGDAKTGACIGAFGGASFGLLVLWITFVCAGLLGAVLLLAGRAGRRSELRLGPWLAAGTLGALAYGRWRSGLLW